MEKYYKIINIDGTVRAIWSSALVSKDFVIGYCLKSGRQWEYTNKEDFLHKNQPEVVQ